MNPFSGPNHFVAGTEGSRDGLISESRRAEKDIPFKHKTLIQQTGWGGLLSRQPASSRLVAYMCDRIDRWSPTLAALRLR